MTRLATGQFSEVRLQAHLSRFSIPETSFDPSESEGQVAVVSTVRSVDEGAPPSFYDVVGHCHEPDVREAQSQQEARQLLRVVEPRLVQMERPFLPVPEQLLINSRKLAI